MSDWTPVHHVHAEEPAADPDKPPADGPTVSQRDGKPAGDKPREAPGSSPVALTLNLPPEFISAMWGYGDNVLRLAIAVEENTKVMREHLIGSRSDPDSDGSRPLKERLGRGDLARSEGR